VEGVEDYSLVQRLILHARKINVLAASGIVIGLTALVAFLDALIDARINVTIFYLVPVIAAVLLSGRTLGWITALVTAVAWLAVAMRFDNFFPSPVYAAWGFLVRIGYHLLFVYLLVAIQDLIERLRQLSLRDPLTHAANRRYFDEHMIRAVRKATRSRASLTLALFDVDDFKAVNDSLGHEAGDEVLRIVARTIMDKIRPDDMLARLGGDEFALVLFDMARERSEEVVDRLFEAVSSELRSKGYHATLSAGVVTYGAIPPGAESRPSALLARADEVMYEVKKGGKNGRKYVLVDS
jgi:diguanylate cyclase (GGDEF)-like protein